jgi:hypothetical protein
LTPKSPVGENKCKWLFFNWIPLKVSGRIWNFVTVKPAVVENFAQACTAIKKAQQLLRLGQGWNQNFKADQNHGPLSDTQKKKESDTFPLLVLKTGLKIFSRWSVFFR